MKKLIVNADDFGYSPGVNKGIIKAHTDEIVTSTSVMVDSIAADESIDLLQYPKLSIGLHYVHNSNGTIVTELERQVQKFTKIVGKLPTHIDIHKTTNNDQLKAALSRYAKENGMHFRYSGEHTFIDTYIGTKTNGDVSMAQLAKSLAEANDAINELMCHVGYADDYIINHSSYNVLREAELDTLCSEEAKEYVIKLGLELTSWSSIKKSSCGVRP